MSAAEWFEISLIAGENSLTGFAILFSLMSGYMVVAYTVGRTLSRNQVLLASSIYTVGCLLMVFSNFSHVRDAIVGRQQAALIAQEIPMGVGLSPVTWASVILVIHRSFLIGSLIFMWQVRHSKTE